MAAIRLSRRANVQKWTFQTAWQGRTRYNKSRGINPAHLGPLTTGQQIKFLPVGLYYNVIDKVQGFNFIDTSPTLDFAVQAAGINAQLRTPTPTNIMLSTGATAGSGSAVVDDSNLVGPEIAQNIEKVKDLTTAYKKEGLTRLIPNKLLTSLSATLAGTFLPAPIAVLAASLSPSAIVAISSLLPYAPFVYGGAALLTILITAATQYGRNKSTIKKMTDLVRSNTSVLKGLTTNEKELVEYLCFNQTTINTKKEDKVNPEQVAKLRALMKKENRIELLLNQPNAIALGLAAGSLIAAFSPSLFAMLPPLLVVTVAPILFTWTAPVAIVLLGVALGLSGVRGKGSRIKTIKKELAELKPEKLPLKQHAPEVLNTLTKILGKGWDRTAIAETTPPPTVTPPVSTGTETVFTTTSGKTFTVIEGDGWPKKGLSAKVYKVKDEHGVVYAIKHFSPNEKALESLGQKERTSIVRELQQRFLDEIKYLEELNIQRGGHRNVIAYHGTGDFEGAPFAVIEFIPHSLKDLMEQNKFNVSAAVKLVMQIAAGLKFMYDNGGFIHRDLKPENVLLKQADDSTVAIVADMGTGKPTNIDDTIAQHREASTTIGRLVGTPRYWAPESILAGGSKSINSPSVDIFALGLILYHLASIATGQEEYYFPGIPNPGKSIKNWKEAIAKLLKDRLYAGVIHPKLFAIIEKMTHINPEERYQDYDEVLTALQSLFKQEEKPSDQTRVVKPEPRTNPLQGTEYADLFGNDLINVLTVVEEIGDGNIYPEADQLDAVRTQLQTIFAQEGLNSRVKDAVELALAMLG